MKFYINLINIIPKFKYGMNIENRVNEILKTTAWFNQQTIQKKESDRQKLKIQTQHIFHEISLIRYFSFNTDSDNFGLSDVSYEEIITVFIQHEPLRLHSKLSPNISQFITQWVFDFTNKPRMFAQGVIKTLPNYPVDSGIFIYVTFPSMFYHFQTDEYLNLAVEFLEEIIQKAPQNISISFVSSFLLCAAKFVKSLWIIFDDLVDKRLPIRTYSDYYVIFIESLKTSSLALTKQHVHIIKYFKQFNLENFAKCLISNFLNITYDESHLSKIHDESRHLIKFLKYAEKNPTSHHFTKIYNALIPKVGTFWVPFHSNLIETKIPLVMNCHEFFLIQQIAKDNPEISNLKYIPYLTVPKKVYLDFCPVYFDVVLPLPPSKINDQLGSIIFGEKFYESEIKNFIIDPSSIKNDKNETNKNSNKNKNSKKINDKNGNENENNESSVENINNNNDNENSNKNTDNCIDDVNSNNNSIKSDICSVSKAVSETEDDKLLSRKWRQITAYARTRNIHPLSLFSSKIVTDRSFSELSKLSIRQDSPLFEYAVKDVYNESLKVHSQFESLINRLLLYDFLKEILHLLFFMLNVVLQKFTMRLISTDRIFDNYHLNGIIGAARWESKFANFAVARYAGHFDAGGEMSCTFKLAFLPSQAKRERVRKMIVDNELYDIFLIGINRKSEGKLNDANNRKSSEQNNNQNTESNNKQNTTSNNVQNLASNTTSNNVQNLTSNRSQNSTSSHHNFASNHSLNSQSKPNPSNSPRFNSASTTLYHASQPTPPRLSSMNQVDVNQNPSTKVTQSYFQSPPPQNPYKHPPSREVPPRSSSFSALNQAQNAPSRTDSQDSTAMETATTATLRKRRRHSQHAIQFIHTSSEFFACVNRVLKSRGRTKSPLEICMISKIIDEWRISYFDHIDSTASNTGYDFVTKSFSNGFRNRQIYRNGEVSEFIISSLQKRFTSNIELWKTKRKIGEATYVTNASKSEISTLTSKTSILMSSFDVLKPALKYVLFVAKEIDQVNNMKKGASIFQMIKIGTLIDQISVKIWSEMKSDTTTSKSNANEKSQLQFLVFECCLLMSKSGGLFETFMLYEKLSADIIGFNTSIPLNVMKFILIVTRCFWRMLKLLDDELYESCIHFVEHVQYSFTI